MAKIKVTNPYGYPTEEIDLPGGEGVEIFFTDPYSYYGGGPENVRTFTFKGSYPNLAKYADLLAQEVLQSSEVNDNILGLAYLSMAFALQVARPELVEPIMGFIAMHQET